MDSNPFETYCAAVCVMVRWKAYHAAITDELTGHMEDHADYLIAKGVAPDEAAAHAVAAMGDPYELGKELDRQHSPWCAWLTVLFTALSAILLLTALTLFLFTMHFGRPRLAPFADAAELLRQEERGSTVLATGKAVGGGTIGAYTFSGTGAAAISIKPWDATAYRLDLMLPSHTPWLWLDSLDPSLLPSSLDDIRCEEISHQTIWKRGLFRRFTSVSFPVEPPFQRSYTVEIGSLSYTVTLEEVAAP